MTPGPLQIPPVPRGRRRAPGPPTKGRLPKWKILQAKDGRWYYLFVGANGEPMFQSTEFWERRTDANRGRDQAKRAVGEAG